MTKNEYNDLCDVSSLLNIAASVLVLSHKNKDIDLDIPTKYFPKGMRLGLDDTLKSYALVEKLLIRYKEGKND